MTKPLIAVDDRQDERFTLALQRPFKVQVKHLTVGDIVWHCPLGPVGVEDKCTNDLTASRRNGRLDDELRRLAAMFPVPILFVRDTALSSYARWSDHSIENLLFGRQLHGINVYRAPGGWAESADSLFHLWEYTQTFRPEGLEGVRREPTRKYTGPLSARAEAVYGILGGVTGIRGRRTIANAIAAHTRVSDFCKWTQTDFLASGFSPLMARKLAAYLGNMEDSIGDS